jgi:hypothetical protein
MASSRREHRLRRAHLPRSLTSSLRLGSWVSNSTAWTTSMFDTACAQRRQKLQCLPVVGPARGNPGRPNQRFVFSASKPSSSGTPSPAPSYKLRRTDRLPPLQPRTDDACLMHGTRMTPTTPLPEPTATPTPPLRVAHGPVDTKPHTRQRRRLRARVRGRRPTQPWRRRWSAWWPPRDCCAHLRADRWTDRRRRRRATLRWTPSAAPWRSCTRRLLMTIRLASETTQRCRAQHARRMPDVKRIPEACACWSPRYVMESRTYTSTETEAVLESCVSSASLLIVSQGTLFPHPYRTAPLASP